MALPRRKARKIDPGILAPYAIPNPGWRHPSWWLAPGLSFFCLIFGFFYGITAPYLTVYCLFPLAVLGILSIWALPDMRKSPSGWLGPLLYAFIAVLIMWPYYLAIKLPGMPLITFQRLFNIPMIIAFLICLSVSSAFRGELKEVNGAVPILGRLVAAFAVVQLVTLPFSHAIGDSVQRAIMQEIVWTGVFFISCWLFRKPGRPERFAYLLWILAVYLCVMGLFEMRVQKPLWAGHIPSFLQIDAAARFMGGITRHGLVAYRVKATYTTPLALAEFLALVTPFLFHFVMGRYRFLTKALAVASLPLVLFIVIQTNSRLGMVGMILAGLVYLMFWGTLRWRRHKGDLIGPAVVAAYPLIFSLAIAATFFVHRLRVLVWGGGAQRSSNEGRAEEIKNGIPKILHNPIGYGAGQSGDVLHYSSFGGSLLSVDNYYLTLALEYGVIGLALFMSMIGASIWYGGRYALRNVHPRDRESELLVPITASMCIFFVIKAVLSQQDNHPVVFMLMGMLVALIWRQKGGGEDGAVAAQPAGQGGALPPARADH
jgi:hypothetical protein